ncbi:MAG: hypothetical protein XXXJIFNMEKO3_02176 [Candidatus Erwinia impunctatus]|nr:hypothetical protein XXXJIFNMEKO_02176 [Culicoides impunctatus]
MSLFDKANDKLDESVGMGQAQLGKTFDSPEHQIKGTLRQGAAKAAYTVDDALDCVRSKTRKAPFVSLAVAAGVGFLAAGLLRRR